MFDLLIVDEASQMHLSSAVAESAVSRQIVVCGDSQQMQPDILNGLMGNEVEGYPIVSEPSDYSGRSRLFGNVT